MCSRVHDVGSRSLGLEQQSSSSDSDGHDGETGSEALAEEVGLTQRGVSGGTTRRNVVDSVLHALWVEARNEKKDLHGRGDGPTSGGDVRRNPTDTASGRRDSSTGTGGDVRSDPTGSRGDGRERTTGSRRNGREDHASSRSHGRQSTTGSGGDSRENTAGSRLEFEVESKSGSDSDQSESHS